jgi:hypothetical protein
MLFPKCLICRWMQMEKWPRTMPMGRGRGEGEEGKTIKTSDEPHAKRGNTEDEA